jgi:F420-dependent oxidoreductase-like protein
MELRIFVEPQQGASYRQQLAVAQLAEQLGFDAFFRSDHYLRMGAGDPLPGPTDSWVTLGAIARETSTIRLGTLVASATFRLPGQLAVAVAQIDDMSDGRIELGLGAGWFDAEHTAYGIPFPTLGQRFDILEEQLEIITGMWNTPIDSQYSFEGQHHTIVGSPAIPKPVQLGGPPIIMGGYGPKRTPALAAKYANEFNLPFPPLEIYRTRPGSRVDDVLGRAGAVRWLERRGNCTSSPEHRPRSRRAHSERRRWFTSTGARQDRVVCRSRRNAHVSAGTRHGRSRPHPLVGRRSDEDSSLSSFVFRG